ncbi:hypothetical protein TKK_0004208 [Trichogramma kaykai]
MHSLENYPLESRPRSYLIVGQCWASTDTNAVGAGINVGPVLVGYWNDNARYWFNASCRYNHEIESQKQALHNLGPVLDTNVEPVLKKKKYFFDTGSIMAPDIGIKPVLDQDEKKKTSTDSQYCASTGP